MEGKHFTLESLFILLMSYNCNPSYKKTSIFFNVSLHAVVKAPSLISKRKWSDFSDRLSVYFRCFLNHQFLMKRAQQLLSRGKETHLVYFNLKRLWYWPAFSLLSLLLLLCRLWFESPLLMPVCTPGPRLVSPAQLLPIDSSALPAATCSLHCQASGTRPSNVPVIWFALIHDEEVVLLQKPDESFFPNSTEKVCDSVSDGV